MSDVLLGRFPVLLDRCLAVPLAGQICQQLRSAITSGLLNDGLVLPSTRALASHLGVSRNTMSAAYEQLAMEGFLTVSQGRRPAVARYDKHALAGRRAAFNGSATAGPPVVSEWAARLMRDIWPVTDEGVARPLMPGLADDRLFPYRVWARCLRNAAVRAERTKVAGPNHATLQRVLLAHLRERRGVIAQPSQLLFVPTAQAALDLIARVVLNPGDIAWTENPGYQGARAAFEAAGAAVRGMTLDQNGVIPDTAATAPAPRCIFLTPSHQYPTGGLMPPGRRLEMLSYVRDTGSFIIEDDYDGEFHYQGAPVSALQGLDAGEHVLYVGTFSKSMHRELRLGYIVAPLSLVALLEKAQRHTGQMVSLTIQDALREFIEDGHYASNIRKMSRVYKARRDYLCDGLRKMNRNLKVKRPDGGMQVLVELPSLKTDEALVRRLASAGVSVRALSPHYASDAARYGMFLGFAAWTETEIEAALGVIQSVLDDFGIA